ncbi:type IV pilus biogenesis protein PilP [Pseudomonas panipatensis]|uniref:type IV pilus biogenesis protein PilP n=1 Tax=Pseudomonas panipatensis TaxID=428992 RepID=UPI0035ADA52B
MRNKHFWLAASICFVLTNAWADDASLSGISVGELGKVQSETILLKAKAERLKAERESNGEDTSSRTQQAPNGFPGAFMQQPTQPAAPSPSRASTEPDLPVVRAITGSSRRLQATLLFSSGYELDASAGKELPGGYRVSQITLDGVFLEREGKHYPLGFSDRPPSPALQPLQQNSAVQQSLPALPGLVPAQR